VANLKYLRTTATNQNWVHEEIKCRLNSGNACYHSVQSLQSSHLVSKNLNIKIYKIIVSSVVLLGCETWSFTLREEHRFRAFENKVLKRKFGPGEVMAGGSRRLHDEKLHNFYASQKIIMI
jgi:hypothetical protein